MKEQLKHVRDAHTKAAAPRADFVRESKAALMQTIKAQAPTHNDRVVGFAGMFDRFAIFLPGNVTYMAVRSFGMIVLVFGIAVGGWGVGVSAARDSVPGEILYNVKLASEKTQVAVAAISGDKEVVAKLNLEFAARRAEEVKKVAHTRPESAAKAVKQLNKLIDSAQKDVAKLGEQDVAKAAGLAKDLNNTAKEIVDDLKDVPVADQDLSADVKDAKDRIIKAQVETAVALVRQTEGGGEAVEERESEEVREVIDETTEILLDEALEITEETKQTLEGKGIETEDVAEEVTVEEVEQGEEIADVVTKTKATAEEIEALQDTLDTPAALDEEEVLPTLNDSLEVLEKAKELKEVADETNDAVQEIALPEDVDTDTDVTSSTPSSALPDILGEQIIDTIESTATGSVFVESTEPTIP